MPTYLVLGNFTEQGIRNIKDTTKRAEAVRAMGQKLGVTVREVFWTLGQYDIATIWEAPDEAAATALALSVGVQGNVRTTMLRAYTATEIPAVLSKM
jgi:uncharacterized protein with GYD domain